MPRMARSYRTAQQPKHDHFLSAGDLVARQTHSIDWLERLPARRESGEPRRKNDHVVGTRFRDVLDHSGLAAAAIRNDLWRHETHQIDDVAPREERDRPDVVEREPYSRRDRCRPRAPSDAWRRRHG